MSKEGKEPSKGKRGHIKEDISLDQREFHPYLLPDGLKVRDIKISSLGWDRALRELSFSWKEDKETTQGQRAWRQ